MDARSRRIVVRSSIAGFVLSAIVVGIALVVAWALVGALLFPLHD